MTVGPITTEDEGEVDGFALVGEVRFEVGRDAIDDGEGTLDLVSLDSWDPIRSNTRCMAKGKCYFLSCKVCVYKHASSSGS